MAFLHCETLGLPSTIENNGELLALVSKFVPTGLEVSTFGHNIGRKQWNEPRKCIILE